MSLYISGPSSRGHMVLPGGDAADEDASGKTQRKQSPHTESNSHSTEEGSSPPITPKKETEEPDSGVHGQQSDREGSLSAITREEVLQTPESGGHAIHSGQLENTPSAMREKVLDDGYNWRKYGQKNVKGNEFVRSYYRCTHPNCQVKKQLERSNDGQITDTVYFGQHSHPKPQQNLPLAVGFAVAILEKRDEQPLTNERVQEKSLHVQPLRQIAPKLSPQLSTVVDGKVSDNAQSNSNRVKHEADGDDHPNSKRQKKTNYNVEAVPVSNHAGQPRLVVQTISQVDFVNDGYRWRKYGQKLVKGNPNPRSYYRCSSPGCPVKKHVERASDNPQTVITTYEGQHDHDMPPSRTVTPKPSGLNATASPHSGELSAKSKEIETDGVNKVGHSVLDSASIAVEHQNGKSVTKPEETEDVGPDTAIQSSSAPEIIPNEQVGKLSTESKPNEQNGASSGKDDIVDSKTSAQVCTGLDSGSREHLNDKSRESDAVDMAAHVRSGCDGNSSEQQIPNSEPVKT